MKLKTILSVLAALCCQILFAQPLQTRSVSIFKNGQAFFIKSGNLRVQDSKFLLPDPAPAALYGTLWLNSTEGTLTKVSSYPDTLREKKMQSAVAIHELLRANIGMNASGVIEKEQPFFGSIVSVSPTRMDERGQPVYDEYSLVTIKDMQLKERWFTIPARMIQYVVFANKPNLQIERENVKPRHLVELSFSTKKAEQPIEMMYLANGLQWAPQYLLELTGDKSATLTLQGEIANNAEDLVNTDLNLVVGVANFQYADRLSFLVNFNEVLQAIAYRRQADYNRFSNALMTQTANYDAEMEDAGGGFPEVEGSANEDLFFYNLKNFSLPKGGRSMQSIFQEKIEIAHIYECNLPPNQEVSRAYEQEFLFTPNEQNKVFHTIKASNNTKQPWTTASIFVVNAQENDRPVSQDLLTYTPAGGKTFIKLTEAPDVKVEQAERETSRQQNAHVDKKAGVSFDLVKVEGKIKISNFKGKKIDLRLKRTITGNLKDSNVDWEKEEIVNPNSRLNKRTNVAWETSVKEKGTAEIVYSYEIYVSSY